MRRWRMSTRAQATLTLLKVLVTGADFSRGPGPLPLLRYSFLLHFHCSRLLLWY